MFSEKEWKILREELSLSGRQGEVVIHLLAGESDKQIATELGIAVPTVRTHLSRLFSRFDVQDRCELIIHIFQHFRNGCRLRENRNECPKWLKGR